MNEPKKKVILFDMDGVIINSEPQHYRGWCRVYARYGITMDYEKYQTVIGCTLPTLAEMVEREYGFTEKSPKELLAEYYECVGEILASEGQCPAEGLLPTLTELRDRGYRMVIASSAPPENILKAMIDTGIENYISAFVSGERVAHPKPAPDTFLEAAKAAHARPEDCIVVEDSGNGVTAAKAAGIFCIGLRNPDSGNQDLSAADRIIRHFYELTEILP